MVSHVGRSPRIPRICRNGDRRRGRTGSSDRAMKEVEKKNRKSGFPTRVSRSSPRADAGENDAPEIHLFGCDTLRHRTRAAPTFQGPKRINKSYFRGSTFVEGRRGWRSKVWGRKLQRNPSIRLNRNRVKGEGNMGRERRENCP